MNKRSKAAYGVLGAPLAMAALPVYIYTPKLYGDEFGLGLALTGLILLFSRIVDTLQDPWLGKLADYLQPRPGGWSRMISVSALLLGVAFIALFNPPALSKVGLVTWLGVSLILVYTAHSALNITYLAWGARASEDSHERTSIVASREGFGLAGVILASLLPMIFGFWLDGPWRWLAFSLAFIAVLLLGTWLLNNHVPKPQGLAGRSRGILHPLRHAQFRRLAFLFLINGLAVAVAATLALFYISDILKLESHTGILLALYFISGAASLPLWLGLSRRLGKPVTWAISTLVAVLAFIWAISLGAGDLVPYAIICILSGAALGADLTLPAAIAADIIPQDERNQAGGYFGIWSLIGKGVLALAAGLTLPLLAFLGYQPGENGGLEALALFYAGIPCVIKLISAALLMRWRPYLEVHHAT